MAHAKNRFDWNHTAHLLAAMYNLVNKQKRKPSEFNPYTEQRRRKPKYRMSIAAFAKAIVKKAKR